VIGVTLSHEATRQRFFRNYAKCGPYDEEPVCSAVKVVPELSGNWRCRATRPVGEGCQNEKYLTGVESHSSLGVAGAARTKERWRNVGGPAWF
jgi:hypothetical protein